MSRMVLVMVLRIFRRTDISFIVAFLMVFMIAAATFETPMNVLLIDTFNEAKVFGIELIQLQ
jgi:hypothetical protein